MDALLIRGRPLAEVVVIFLFYEFFAKAVIAGAEFAGIVLPDQPLLGHTYLLFVSVLLVISWLWYKRVDFSQFGLVRPASLIKPILWGIVLALVLVVVDGLVRSVSTPLIVSWTGADPHQDVQKFASLRGDLQTLLVTLPSVWLFAAFGEEFMYRGYLLTRFRQILGGMRFAPGLAIFGQAILFGLAHSYQGPIGMVPITIGAIVSGIAATVWGRTLWPVMVAHGLVDTLGFVMLYTGAM